MTLSPSCPDCGKGMFKRVSETGGFWGCEDYPKCKGTVRGKTKIEHEIEEMDRAVGLVNR